MDPTKPDITVENHGSLFVFRTWTPEATDWVRENVEIAPWNTVGANGFSCAHRFARDLAEGMIEAGFNVV